MPAALRRRPVLLALGALAAPGSVHAQSDFPTRPIRMIVPSAAGSGQDILGRVVAQRLAELWGQPVVVENRVGAGGTIGSDLIAKAPKDGYTIGVINSSSMAISPALLPSVPYDPLTSFTPLGLGASNDCALAVKQDSPFRSVADVVAAAKARPGQLTWASAGSGTSTHMAGELFRLEAGVDIVHVPYRGSPAALTALLGGQVDMLFNTINSLLAAVRNDQIRALATTGRSRDPLLPQVPSFVEAGFARYEASGWLGFAGPAGLPPEILRKLSDGIRQVTQSEPFQQTMITAGMRPQSSTAPEFRDYMAVEIGRWADIARRSGAKMD
ncbi:tripartite tricarboxylate transporter substrate binding protein [Roseomonas sp. AR75]|uniref:Bug family tripartite tricarboxylate transporter substrate binding protein n=1 Tax=Roseomonas sp. AR75 TaxID=2562311 RepID=UPI0010C05B4D|nr:tripartite tricarboxylate transporter substrate binding protein [Roseomonas sp. AR75]